MHCMGGCILNKLIKVHEAFLTSPFRERESYRVNCGGPDYKDSYGNLWLADREKDRLKPGGSVSGQSNSPAC